ncbi:ribosomal-protein-alanine N-acetyltransferase [Flavobacteriaceae bacterium MAR_2010_188]|nr:ribosomal-protein-alanine N-acetyltransferase [Flavobacteriaceae bacterium MAR_2010_188]
MIRNGKRFQQYLPKTLSQNLSEESSKKYIKEKNLEIENLEVFTLAIKDIQQKMIAGLIILKEIDQTEKSGEFAYCIGKEFEGQGWVTKSIRAFSEFAFTKLKLLTLHIIIHRNNKASIKVAENSGFEWKRTLYNEFTPITKVPMDMELYELCYER